MAHKGSEPINIGDDREMVLFSGGTVFCSLTPEEVTAEREAAKERMEAFNDMMLRERASRMTKEDFITEWNTWQKYNESREDYMHHHVRDGMDAEVMWDEWNYERESYDREKATAYKAKKYKHFQIIREHISIAIFVSLSIMEYVKNEMGFALFTAAIALVYIITSASKWYNLYKVRDTIETVGE